MSGPGIGSRGNGFRRKPAVSEGDRVEPEKWIICIKINILTVKFKIRKNSNHKHELVKVEERRKGRNFQTTLRSSMAQTIFSMAASFGPRGRSPGELWESAAFRQVRWILFFMRRRRRESISIPAQVSRMLF